MSEERGQYDKKPQHQPIVDITDAFYFAGLSAIGYGVHAEFGAGVAAIVVGSILVATSYRAY